MRHKPAPRRKIEPDFKHNSALVAKFINQVMRKGKKTIAQKVVYGAFDILKNKYQKDPIPAFEEVIKNVSPMLEIKSRRIGGATYQVPREVRGDRRVTLAMRWILLAAHNKKGKPMAEKLAEEFIAALKKEGSAIKKREDTHRMAEANKAFAHFAW